VPLDSSYQKELSTAKIDQSESTSAKVLRELDLLGGAGTGFVKAAKEAIDNPGETVLKAGGAAAVGVGLSLALRKPGMLALSAKTFGLAGGVAFGAEVVGHGADVAAAAKSSWQSDSNHENNKKVVGTSAGAFLFDTALMGAAGSAGAVGTRYYFARQAAAKIEIPLVKLGEAAVVDSKISVSKYDEMAQLYKNMTGKVGRVETLASNGSGLEGRFGTAFAYGKDGTMVTNHHVVDKAIELTVFDRFGQAHKAEVLKSIPFEDLALIRLKDPRAAAKFTEVPIAGSDIVKANVAGEPVFTLGFPKGWQKPFLSPGETMNATRVDPLDMRVRLHTEDGNSGGPIFNKDGGLVGVLKQGDRSNRDVSILTPAERVTALLDGTKIAARSPVSLPVVSRQSYRIQDSEAAAANIEKLFPLQSRLDGNSEFFHSKITRVLMPTKGNNLSEVMLRSQYQPKSREIVVEPLAIDGKPLTAEMHWPGSDVSMSGSKLTLKLDRSQTPYLMESVNDPKNFLRRAFDHKSSGNYLAGLEPTKVSPFKVQVKRSLENALEWLHGGVPHI
jgi:S1-C subfamily serine protease